MKYGFLFALVLLIGSVATHFLLQDNGYVLINFRGYIVQMSVPILAFLLVLAYLLTRLILRIWQTPRELGEFAARKKEERTSRQIIRGYIAMSEGKLARAERLLTKGAANSQAPLLNYLAAARAAQTQGDRERRDGWLKMAYEQDDGAGNAVLLTQAEMQLADGEFEKARASLNRVRENTSNHPQAIKMLAELHRAERDWSELAALLPELRKNKLVSPTNLARWTIETYQELLADPALDKPGIEALWSQLSRPERKAIELVRARVSALIRCGEKNLAETEIRKALKHAWNADLVAQYGMLELGDTARQLRHVESWLNARPEDPLLLLAAGRICIRSQLWGKARSYLESSLAISPSAEGYHQLGQLMLQLDDRTAASDAFQKGLVLSNAGTPGVPQLENK
jgi:HemY protein